MRHVKVEVRVRVRVMVPLSLCVRVSVRVRDISQVRARLRARFRMRARMSRLSSRACLAALSRRSWLRRMAMRWSSEGASPSCPSWLATAYPIAVFRQAVENLPSRVVLVN